MSRLDRVKNRDLELALWLYYHVELLRAVIEHACLPPHVRRVAISLDHPTRGPFIILSRGARFITCLARDMTPYDGPVISRDLLDRVVAQTSSMKR